MREAIKNKRRGKLGRGILFHQDNAPAHTSRIARAAIHEAGFELLERPAYSPDLVPSDYYLFPKLKSQLKGNRYDNDNEVKAAAERYFEDKDKLLL